MSQGSPGSMMFHRMSLLVLLENVPRLCREEVTCQQLIRTLNKFYCLSEQIIKLTAISHSIYPFKFSPRQASLLLQLYFCLNAPFLLISLYLLLMQDKKLNPQRSGALQDRKTTKTHSSGKSTQMSGKISKIYFANFPSISKIPSDSKHKKTEKGSFKESQEVVGSSRQLLGKGSSSEVQLHHLIASKLTHLTNKGKEELNQENTQLKKKLGKLEEELLHQKTHIRTIKQQKSKTLKQYEMHFEKELYWQGNNQHMVCGIKTQYLTLKNKYEQKCQECDEMLKDTDYSKHQENKISCQILQEQNKRLTRQLQALLNQKPAQQHYIDKKNTEKWDQEKVLVKQMKEKLKEKQSKINFLDTLIKSKDNQIHQKDKKIKKITEQNMDLESQIRTLNKKMQVQKEQYEQKFEENKQKLDHQIQSANYEHQKLILLKNNQISKLERETQEFYTAIRYYRSHQNEAKAPDPTPELLPAQQEVVSYAFSTQIVEKEPQVMPASEFTDKIEEKQALRVQRTADRRFSDKAVKAKAVTKQQIQDSVHSIRYRLIAHNISSDTLKNFFSFNEKHTSFQNPQKLQWQRQYLNLKQCKEVLQEHNDIFQLQDEERTLLSRYLVEDYDNSSADVFYDQENENKRAIVKSILNALVGEYQLDQSKMKSELEQFLQKKGRNVKATLNLTHPKGEVSHYEFIDIIDSLGAKISQELKDYIIAKMFIKSESLKRLKYSVVF